MNYSEMLLVNPVRKQRACCRHWRQQKQLYVSHLNLKSRTPLRPALFFLLVFFGTASCAYPPSAPSDITRSRNSYTLSRSQGVEIHPKLSPPFILTTTTNPKLEYDASSDVDNNYYDYEKQSNGHVNVIGDSHRSQSSSTSFFQSIDRDGDGTLRPQELSHFLRESIGGTSFDEQNEVETEITSVMSKLDLNQDDELSVKDVFSYWKSLDSLLTVEEVAEWVVHAVQLPDDIGRIFRDNHVTGYDFPELVENNGIALQSELSIQKLSFRRKIVRLVQARMLGVGSVPTPPGGKINDDGSGIVSTVIYGAAKDSRDDYGIQIKVKTCSTVILSWKKSEARGFPVHSYRVQKRVLGGVTSSITHENDVNSDNSNTGSHSVSDSSGLCKNDALDSSMCILSNEGIPFTSDQANENRQQQVRSGTASTTDTTKSSSLTSTSEWKTVYVGADAEFVDTKLEPGKEYFYRIQAWNSAGKSPWAQVEINNALKKMKCAAKKISYAKDFMALFAHNHADDGHSAKYYGNHNFNSSHLNSLSLAYADSGLLGIPRVLIMGLWFLIKFTFTCSKVIFALITMAAAIMKYRRAAAASTSAPLKPLCPWLWQGINRLAMRAFGVRIFPENVACRRESMARISHEHDFKVNAVGLKGYEKSTRSSTTSSVRNSSIASNYGHSSGTEKNGIKTKKVEAKHKSMKRTDKNDISAETQGGSKYSTKNHSTADNGKEKIKAENLSKAKKLKNFFRLNKNVEIDASSTTSRGISTGSARSLSNSFRNRRSSTLKSSFSLPETTTSGRLPSLFEGAKRFMIYPGTSADHKPQVRNMQLSRRSSLGGSVRTLTSELTDTIPYDDYALCNTCHKKYKFPKRCRHHCSRCTATFCHKHGRTTHPSFIVCKVPGNCVCNVCLGKGIK